MRSDFSPMFSHSHLSFMSCFGCFGAGFTRSSTMMSTCILFDIFMASNTMSLFRLFSHETFTPHNVFSMWHRLQMIGIYTKFIFTEMVNIMANSCWTIYQFITKSISLNDLVFCFRDMKDSVAFSVSTCCPYPATIMNFVYLKPKVCHWTDYNAIYMEGKP